jgi:hypothetical protein
MSTLKELDYSPGELENIKTWLTQQLADGQVHPYEVFIDNTLTIKRTINPEEIDSITKIITLQTGFIKIVIYPPGSVKSTHTNKYLLHCRKSGSLPAYALLQFMQQSEHTLQTILAGREDVAKQLDDCHLRVRELEMQVENSKLEKERLQKQLEKEAKLTARLLDENKAIRANPWGSFNWGNLIGGVIEKSFTNDIRTNMGIELYQATPEATVTAMKQTDKVTTLTEGKAQEVELIQEVETMPLERKGTSTQKTGLREEDAKRYFRLIFDAEQRLPETYRQVFWELINYLKNDPATLWATWEVVRELKGNQIYKGHGSI